MEIKVISQTDIVLGKVMALGKRNAKTLGLFPEGAFIEHARKGWILAALEDDVVLGYVLFRLTQSTRIVSIAHLCIETEQRNKGVGKKLINAVREKYQNLFRGISLNCRKDYIEASKFYEKFGFKAVKEVKSKSKGDKYLVKWHFDFGNDDLFSATLLPETKTSVLLDASILIKLRESTDSNQNEASALNADWLNDEVEYFYAQEMYNEINRDVDKARAIRTRSFLQNYSHAQFKPEDSEKIYRELQKYLSGQNVNDISDRKQLSECIASGIECFVTTDTALLEASEIVYEKYSTRILSPIQLILFIDQLNNKFDYRTARLAGAVYETRQIEASDISLLADTFVVRELNEKKHEFKNRVNSVLANIKKSYFKVVKGLEDNYIGLVGGVLEEKNVNISIIRTNKSKVSSVLFNQLISSVCNYCVECGLNKIIISDIYLNETQLLALKSIGFEKKGNCWIRFSIKGQHNGTEFINDPSLLPDLLESKLLATKLSTYNIHEQNLFKLRIERKLWPLKFTEIEIPTYVIPIKPYWASQLFDYHLSDQTLFGSKAELVWNRENIYYRSVKPVSEKFPARILWYISSDSRSNSIRQMGIVACSYLDEVHTDSAKNLFQRFKNYGIYEWKHVYNLAGKNSSTEIKALNFSDTEVFKEVIPKEVVAKIFISNGRRKNTFASPVEVSKEIFNEIYKIGKGL